MGSKKIKEIIFNTSSYKKGKNISLQFVGDNGITKTILEEVFGRQDYKPLLTYIRKIKNPVVLDIGSHIGSASLYFAQKKDARIYAVEANPYNYECLLQNIKDYPNITADCVGIAGTEGKQKLYTTDQNTMEETMLSADNKKKKGIPVNTISLETFMATKGITHVDAMKIDVEGMEFEIFMLPAFRRIVGTIDFIIGEAHIRPIAYYMIEPILEQYGFTVTWSPVTNAYDSLTIGLDNGDIYTVKKQLSTIFIATRP